MATSTKGTVREAASVDPLDGVTVSQPGPPESVEEAADQFIEPCPIFSTPKFCGGGAPPPNTAVKVKPVWERRMVCVPAATVMMTGTVIPPASGLLIDTRPVEGPAASPCGFAVTA